MDTLPFAADDWQDEPPTVPALPGQPIGLKVEHSFALVCKTRVFDLSEIVPIFVDDSEWTASAPLRGNALVGIAGHCGASHGPALHGVAPQGVTLRGGR